MKRDIFTRTILISVTALFFVWMIFLDDFNFIRQVKLKKLRRELKDKESYYHKNIQRDSVKLFYLRTNRDSLEKYAREKYLMKKEDEDLFLILDND